MIPTQTALNANTIQYNCQFAITYTYYLVLSYQHEHHPTQYNTIQWILSIQLTNTNTINKYYPIYIQYYSTYILAYKCYQYKYCQSSTTTINTMAYKYHRYKYYPFYELFTIVTEWQWSHGPSEKWCFYECSVIITSSTIFAKNQWI